MKITMERPTKAWSYEVLAANLMLLTPFRENIQQWLHDDWWLLSFLAGNSLLIGMAACVVLDVVARRSVKSMLDEHERETIARLNEHMALVRTEMRKHDEGEEWKR